VDYAAVANDLKDSSCVRSALAERQDTVMKLVHRNVVAVLAFFGSAGTAPVACRTATAMESEQRSLTGACT
jgi:hypothetical protein